MWMEKSIKIWGMHCNYIIDKNSVNIYVAKKNVNRMAIFNAEKKLTCVKRVYFSLG